MDVTTTQQKMARFGRAMAMLLNRGLMYQKNHPMVKNSITELQNAADKLFEIVSPIVFILNRDQFYIDEEPLDQRINIKRIAGLFDKNGIQSVSFENGLTTSELDIFIDIFSSLTTIKDAQTIKKSLTAKGVFNIQVNHVVYKKVTEDDQIVSREALKKVTPDLEDDDQESRKRFMETLLESALSEEFAKTLNIQSLIANPTALSQSMIEADLANADRTMAEAEANETAYDIDTDTAAADDLQDLESKDPAFNKGGGGAAGTGSGPGTGGLGPGPGGGGTGAGPGAGGLGPGLGTGGTGSGPGAGGLGAGTGEGGSGSGPGAGGTGSGPGAGGLGPGLGAGGTGSGPGAGGLGAGTGEGGSGSGPGAGGLGPVPGGGGPGAGPGTGGMGPGQDGAPGGAVAGDRGGATAAFKGAKTASGPKTGHGHVLIHQLDLMHQEVEKHLQGTSEVSLEDLADAIFKMKKELFEGIETQKALGVAYANETGIIQSANQLTDKVILRLIREEYKSSPELPIKRLAMIITRLVPEAKDLKRLLPKIKKILVDEGMPLADYLDLVQELKNELQSDELARVLQESSDAIGVDGQGLIDEIKQNPSQAAKLIYLASEIKKGTGDDSALSNILVDYVEQMAMDAADDSSEQGEDHLKNVVTNVESTILGQLGNMNLGADVLLKMEDRINERMESILDKMRVEWLKSHSTTQKTDRKHLSVLQTIEHSVADDEDLEGILKKIRAKVDDGDIDENNFSQIQAEITLQRERLKTAADKTALPEGVLKPDELIFVLDKEIARANRYSAPFSALAFSFVKAKPVTKSITTVITTEAIMASALEMLTMSIREVDYIGQIGKNKMVALLPMLTQPEAKKALNRVMNVFHSKPLDVNGVLVQLRVAGVITTYHENQNLDAHAFAKQLTNQLMDMVARVKNIQVLF